MPTHLRVEHLDEPLGIDARKPRLSWHLPQGAREQVAYQLRAGEWDSGRVPSQQSLLLPYEGPPLVSGERVTWQVKVWTNQGESGWSDPAWWEMGLLEPGDWVARWIQPAESDEVRGRTLHPAYLLRGSFTLRAPIERARLYATAHGIYECLLNGQRIGDLELTPGFTSYRSNLQVQTFDVTDLLRVGENVLGAILSDGWFRGQTSGLRVTHVYGDSVALLAQLDLHGVDGTLTRFATGPDWCAATGAIRAADLIEGQIVDLSCEPAGWAAVEIGAYDLGRLRSSPSPPVRAVERLQPVSVTRPRPGLQVFDLGRNINGWIRLTNLGPAGTTLRLTYGEALGREGGVTLENVRMPEVSEATFPLPNRQRPLQVDQVKSAGSPGSSFEPRHTTHGFRYVAIEGHPGELSPDDVTGIVVQTDLRRTGWFECSDEKLNRLHEAAVWSLRGNVCDVPTDCPTRERAGWTGDWQLFVPTAAFLYDVAGFSTKWLRDLAADQLSDGRVTHFVPDTMPSDIPNNPIPHGSAGWGDAAVIVPWEIYRAYGDRRLLEEQWPSMVAWVEYAARAARERRHPYRIAARPTPAPHEQFIWDSGFHFGEWLEPGQPVEPDLDQRARADQGAVATAYLHRSSHLLTEIASVLGRDGAAKRYRELASATRAAWQAEFVGPDGGLAPDTQATCVRALAFDLVDESLRPRVALRLVELIRAAGTHLATGFLATPYLLPVLADTGHLDVAYELLLQHTEPSWLRMIDLGATTVWERWDGIDGDGCPHGSLNHYSKGAVVSFLHRYVAGIQLLDGEPAYRRFRIAPRPGGGITSAQAIHDSPCGRIEAAWRVEGDGFTLRATVPPGSSAEVCLPDGRRFEAQPGSASYAAGLP